MSRWAAGISITLFGESCCCLFAATRNWQKWGHRRQLSFDLLSRLLALSYGMGAALTLDEFALWLNLDALAYWSKQGRESIDAVILFGATPRNRNLGCPFVSAAPATNLVE